MSVEKIQRDLTNLFNYPSDPNPTTQADYITAVKNWVGNVINLVDIGLWQPETAYEVGAIVRTPSLPVFALKCITAGTSDVTEPDYTDVSEGDTVQDNDVEWIICTINTENSDSKANVNASNIGVNAEIDNSELWGSAIGGGEIAEDDGKLVTGGTVYAVTNGLASDIADNTDDIATNTENIAQNTTDIDIADKRISNIEKLLQGNLYDYQTDTDTAYTKSVPSGAMPYAGLEKVGGKTVVMNQLISGAFTATLPSHTDNGITIAGNNDGSISFNGTREAEIQIQYRTDAQISTLLIDGHKYLLTSDHNDKVNFFFYGLGNQRSGTIGTYTDNGNKRLYAQTLSSVAQYDNLKVYPVLYDLTLMFGAGNEPSTVAEFESMFPASYYPYNAGTLLSAGVTEVESVGKNLLLIASTPGGVNGITATLNTTTQELHIYGTASGNGDSLFNLTHNIKVKNGQSITITLQGSGSITGTTTIILRDVNNEYFATSAISEIRTGVWGATFTMTEAREIKQILYRVNSASSLNVTVHMQIEYGSTATNYAPYIGTIATYTIPAEVQALEGYGWSAGSVYNYVDFERKKFVKCVDRVDLGSLNWTRNETQVAGIYYFVTNGNSIPNIKTFDNYSLWNICSIYTVVTAANIVMGNAPNKTIGGWDGKGVRVRDDSYSTASSFKSAVSNIMLFYELATPVETDISAYLTDDNLIQVESGGTLTFPNSNGDDYRLPVPSEEEYMIDLQEAINNG